MLSGRIRNPPEKPLHLSRICDPAGLDSTRPLGFQKNHRLFTGIRAGQLPLDFSENDPMLSKNSTSRALIIGLDGATFNLITPLMAQGLLPNLARMMQEGSWGELRSTIQPSSEQAWAAFMTGTNNGKFGVYGFQKRRAGTYQFDYVNGRSIHGRSLWRILSDRGRRVIVINVPMTYPPEPVNGVLISGLMTPGVHSKFTYPDGIYQELCEVCGDYRIDVDIESGKMSEAQLLALADDAIDMIRLRTCATLHLARTRPWDFLMVMYDASDRLAHKFWKYWDVNHPLHEPDKADTLGQVLPRIYQELDKAVGELVDALAEENVTTYIISDHGFGPMEKAVYLNRWLAQKGYLVFKSGISGNPREQAQLAMRAALRKAVHRLDFPLVGRMKRWGFHHFPQIKGMLYSSVAFAQVDWSKTRAYALGTMGNIYLNLEGREPQGTVTPGEEANAVIDQLMADLRTLVDPDTGEPVFFAVYRGDELYHGPYATDAPDVVGVKDHRYHIVTADWQNGDEIVVPLGDALHFVSDQSGQHALDGVLFARGQGIRQRRQVHGARLMDMAPTILYTLNEPIPDVMDGVVLTDLFDQEMLEKRPIHIVSEDVAEVRDRGEEETEEDREAIRKHLAGLGYLD